MKYYRHQFVPCDRVLELYFSGCSLKCPDCHNKELWDSKLVKETSPIDIVSTLTDYIPITRHIHLLGGEPLNQSETEMEKLCFNLRSIFPYSTIILFTGYDFLHVNGSLGFMFQSPVTKTTFPYRISKTIIDYIKSGSYDSNLVLKEKKSYLINGVNISLATANQKITKIE